MSGVLERSLKMLEFLSEHPEGVPVSAMAAALQIPLSASHRLLSELIHFGYVRQDVHEEQMKAIRAEQARQADSIKWATRAAAGAVITVIVGFIAAFGIPT